LDDRFYGLIVQTQKISLWFAEASDIKHLFDKWLKWRESIGISVYENTVSASGLYKRQVLVG
jgi:hypothetical protein